MKKTNTDRQTQSGKKIIEKKEANQFDKVIKENLDAVLPMLMKRIVGLEIKTMQEIRFDIQRTKERISDSLSLVTDINNETFILHNEFQVKDDPDMVYRMNEYYGMILRKYKLEIRQYVFYLSDDMPKMMTEINHKRLKFSFDLIPMNSISYKVFLESANPAENILAILGNNDGETQNKVIDDIVSHIILQVPTELEQRKFLQQLLIISRLRKLQQITENIMENISYYINVEEDVFYRKGEAVGEAIGEAKKSRKIVQSLLLESNFSVEKIAHLADVSIDFVLEIKKELASNKTEN